MAEVDRTADEAFPFVEGGFQFENTLRNDMILQAGGGNNLPKAHKTGTTLAGCVFNGGVVLGADTRATSSLVVDKSCEKIHKIADNIWCCGAGTAADTEAVTGQIESQLELLRLSTGKEPRVVTAMTMLKRHLYGYQGHVSAALILGGVDVKGSFLYSIYPHGSVDRLPFTTMGSGSLAAMSELEAGYKDGLTEEEAIELVANAIMAGVNNDLGSGSNVDIAILKPGEKVDRRIHYIEANPVAPVRATVNRPANFGAWPVGTTQVTSERVENLVDVSTNAMDLN
mmetsp:Transcript_22128/g.39245  ORF Transcript_22128/g.39245 Transcript_22128/m.39245 type:complete len:284 (+) Transcript_22128:126-977(+)